MSKNLVPNAKKVDNPIYWINLYPEDSAIPTKGATPIFGLMRVCATEQGVIFKVLSLKQGTQFHY